MTRKYQLSVKLTKAQTVLGWLWIPVYLFGLVLALRYVSATWLPMDGVTMNAVYHGINLLFIVLVFGGFLVKSLRAAWKDFWPVLQSLILGLALYYVGTWLLTKLLGHIVTFNDRTVGEYVTQNPALMLVCSLFAAPIIEEVLIRGVAFGSLQPRSRVLAYIVSSLLFCLMHVWQYDAPALSLLAAAACYLPGAVALGWTYEKSGTIWAPILLHVLINALSFGVLSLF